MWIAVIPAYNEASAINTTITNTFSAQVDLILLVANGCSDRTCAEAYRACNHKALKILHFTQPLGLDVPKAIGAAYALKYRPRGVLFLDGDMNGPIQPLLTNLMSAIENGLDLALTDCYPKKEQRSDLANQVLKARKELNVQLELYEKIGVATPSHGPHGISGKLLAELDLRNLAIPPKILVQSKALSAAIDIGAAIPHDKLGSTTRTPLHAEKIAQTIINDCQEALAMFKPSPIVYNIVDNINRSYRSERRLDILEHFLLSLDISR
ncbi:MAG: glycosyl transferase family 2 [Peptococcia bacterium]